MSAVADVLRRAAELIERGETCVDCAIEDASRPHAPLQAVYDAAWPAAWEVDTQAEVVAALRAAAERADA